LARLLLYLGLLGLLADGEPVDPGGSPMPLQGLVFLCALLAPIAVIAAPSTDDTVLLVAQRELQSEIFGSAIIIVKPTADGGHMGFIINRPTTATLGDLFPEHEPSKKVVDPLYLGGPEGYNRVFALVDRKDTAGKDALPLMPGVFLVADGKAVDHVIEADPEHARFFLGLVTWRPGQLDEEIDKGYWYVDEPDAKLILEKKTDGLWEELVRRSEAKAHSI
jgi:putative AlgH/UPF0301 family transcriptional regulator